jgi:hypothetical protein
MKNYQSWLNETAINFKDDIEAAITNLPLKLETIKTGNLRLIIDINKAGDYVKIVCDNWKIEYRKKYEDAVHGSLKHLSSPNLIKIITFIVYQHGNVKWEDSKKWDFNFTLTESGIRDLVNWLTSKIEENFIRYMSRYFEPVDFIESKPINILNFIELLEDSYDQESLDFFKNKFPPALLSLLSRQILYMGCIAKLEKKQSHFSIYNTTTFYWDLVTTISSASQSYHHLWSISLELKLNKKEKTIHYILINSDPTKDASGFSTPDRVKLWKNLKSPANYKGVSELVKEVTNLNRANRLGLV